MYLLLRCPPLHILNSHTAAYSVRESPRCESAGNDGSHQLRLVGLNSTMAGHVEVCTSEGVWSKLLISDVGLWSRKNSIVVCSELGYLNALHVTNFNERYAVDLVEHSLIYMHFTMVCINE